MTTIAIITSALCAAMLILYIVTTKKLSADNKALTLQASTLREQVARGEERFNERQERVAEREGRIALLENEVNDLTRRINADNKTHAETLDAERSRAARLEERLAFIESEKEKLAQEYEQRFKLLAGEILDNNTAKFKEQSEQRLNDLLTPLKDEIERFKKSVNDAYSTEARERFALGERIKELVQLNETIGREAKELTRALKGDSKIQGDWGEMILETLLEKSGLKKDIHFVLQQTCDAQGNTLKDNQGRNLRPDAVIYYPDDRCVIVDSKVSLTAYVSMINAEPASAEYSEAAAAHIRSIKQHIKELSTKNYQDYVGEKKADFVTMFIPNEGAYMAAMNLEPQLWQEAYDQRVLIVSPTHLLSFLRLAEQMWRQDDMKRNVMTVALESGKMYDKFVGFVDDMSQIGKALNNAGKAYEEAMGKLSTGRGNLIGRAEKLKAMGAKTSKSINQALTERALQEPDDDIQQLNAGN